MEQHNRYYRRSRISEKKFRQLLRYFALDLTASKAAELTGLTRKTVNTIFQKIRVRVVAECALYAPIRSGEIEVDESYFGPKRVKGKRGRGASGKTIVFGIFKRNGWVYTEIVPDCQKATLQAIIRGRVLPDVIVHSDKWRGYDGLVDVGYEKHFRVSHGDNQFASGTNHINGIESFWSFAKRRMLKFNGLRANAFFSHLKESEFRFNYRRDDLYKILLRLLQQKPL
ncbi:MAG TPA: IS1595 family transposase [Pyrinomonadaceae bacterium]|jgi:transposase-like protein|nr:IS1595 family transposase [Pyrinomonadaceae bacterium]